MTWNGNNLKSRVPASYEFMKINYIPYFTTRIQDIESSFIFSDTSLSMARHCRTVTGAGSEPERRTLTGPPAPAGTMNQSLRPLLRPSPRQAPGEPRSPFQDRPPQQRRRAVRPAAGGRVAQPAAGGPGPGPGRGRVRCKRRLESCSVEAERHHHCRRRCASHGAQQSESGLRAPAAAPAAVFAAGAS